MCHNKKVFNLQGIIMGELFASIDHTMTLASILNSIQEAVCVADKNMNFKAANNLFAAFYGITPNQLLNKNAFDMYPGFAKSVFYEACKKTIDTGETSLRIGYSNNLQKWIVVRAYMIDPDSCCVVVHELLGGMSKVGYVNNYDGLTSLPNRFSFENEISQIIDHVQSFSISLLDISRFHTVNETLGYNFGDKCLMKIAARIKENASINSKLYRFSGDQFLLLSTDTHHNSLKELEDINCAFTTSFQIDEKDIFFSINIGHSYIQNGFLEEQKERNTNPLKTVEIALSHAKKQKIAYVQYEDGMNNSSKEDLFLTKEIRDAIKNREFFLHYQPLCDSVSNQVYGAECLIRWNHPTRGFLSPIAFLPFAEETGLIGEIDRFVMQEVILSLADLKKSNKIISLSFNLSSYSICDLKTIEYFKELQSKYNFDPTLLTVEITETSLMSNIESSKQVIQFLKDLGVKVAIDDFGTGYSSMEYLVRYPTDYIKIDREFVKNMLSSDTHSIMVGNIIKLGHSLGISIVAEGVEKQDELDMLKLYECDVIQGYFYSKPLKFTDFENFLEQKGIARTYSLIR
jgi:diguanylate cyclase (GGDEF)-like protein